MTRFKTIYSNNKFHITSNNGFANFELVFQAIYDNKSKDIEAYEIFPILISQSGEDFDKPDLFEDIDSELIKTFSLSKLRYAKRKNFSVPVVINIPISCLLDDVFVSHLIQYAHIGLILSVNDIDTNLDAFILRGHINQLRKMRTKLWLGNYHPRNEEQNSTLGILPWDSIRVSKELTHQYQDQPQVLQSLHFALAPFVNQRVVFDGVDNFALARALAPLEVLVQGYHYHLPMTWHELLILQQTHQYEDDKIKNNFQLSKHRYSYSESMV